MTGTLVAMPIDGGGNVGAVGSGVVVGDYSDADEFVHVFTWTEAEGFTTLDFQNNLTGMRAINQRGDISGIYFDGVTLHGFLRPKNGTEVTIDPPDSVWTDTAVVNSRGTVAGAYSDASSNGHGYIAIHCGSRDSPKECGSRGLTTDS